MMATQKFPSSFLQTGLMAFLLLMILDVTFAAKTVATDEILPPNTTDENITDAFMMLETKVSFLEKNIGKTLREKAFSERLKKNPMQELNALKEKLETNRCKDTNIIPVKHNEINVDCLLPEGYCEQKDLFPNDIKDLKDVDEKFLPYLVCFVKPSKPDNKEKKRLLKKISKADEKKIKAILQEVDKKTLSEKIKTVKNFLKMLPQNILLNSGIFIKRQKSKKSFNTPTSINRLDRSKNTNRPSRNVTPSSRWLTKPDSKKPFKTTTRLDTSKNTNRPSRNETPSSRWLTKPNSKRPFKTTTRLDTSKNTDRPSRNETPSSRWLTKPNSKKPFKTTTRLDTSKNTDRPSRNVTPSSRWLRKRKSRRPFRTTTPMNKRRTRKPKKKPQKKSNLQLKKTLMNDSDALSDPSVINKVAFQFLLKMPRKKLCSLLPKLPNLELTRGIIIYNLCKEELKEIGFTVSKKLSRLISSLKRQDIINLKNIQLKYLAAAVCPFESSVNNRVERLLAKKVLLVRVLKRDDQTEFLKKASCLLKYIKLSDLSKIKLSDKNKKSFCKMVGASQLDKLKEGEARDLTKYCIKEVLRNKMELSELGNLMKYIILSDIRDVTKSQLLSWTSILQHVMDKDEEMQYLANKLNKVYKNKFPNMTAEDLKKLGVTVGLWDSKDRRKIPSETWSRSLPSFVSTCQKMDLENNNNFKFCYKIIPFVLKTQAKFRDDTEFLRIKREAGVQETAPLTCTDISQIRSLVKTLTVEQIKSISKEEFLKCIQIFAKATNYTSEQIQSFMVLVNMTFGPAKNWSAENITNLGSLLTVLPLDQIKNINFSNTNIVGNLGRSPVFTKHQLTELFGNWLNITKLGKSSNINLRDIQLVGNLLCGISKTDLEKISAQVIMDGIVNIGKLGFCNITDQRMLLDKVLTSIKELVPKISSEFLTSLGPLIHLLNETTLVSLNVSDLQNISSDLIAGIPALQAAAFKEIILPQLNTLVNVSEVNILVTILCETRNVNNLKSLTGAIQNLTQNTLTCTTRDRDMLLKKLLNSSSATVTDIFKQVIKNISSLIERPSRNILVNFTQEQIADIIDEVMMKIPTMHLDSLFNKWLKDQTIINEITPLDQQMLAFLACGLGIGLEDIDQINGDFIRDALSSEEIRFSCTVNEQKQWLMKSFQFANDMLQTLADSSGIEIDSITGTIKKLGFPSASSLLNLEIMENADLFQNILELNKFMLDAINATERYFRNASVLAVTSTLCHINVTDITKIDENLLRNFLAGQHKPCSPDKTKAWLAAIINSTMHKLVEMNAEQLQYLMTKLDTLLKSNKTLYNITRMLTNITRSQVTELLKMLSSPMKDDTRSPELNALLEISTCLGNLNESQLNTLNPVEKLKHVIDECIKPLNGLENIMNSTSVKLANMAVDYLHAMKVMYERLNVTEMLEKWKVYETISSLPLANASAINDTLEQWLKELKLSNISVNISPKHVLLSFLACNLELEASNFNIIPESIKKAVETFVHGEPCSPEKQRSWLSKNSDFLSRVMNNLAAVLKNMTTFKGGDVMEGQKESGSGTTDRTVSGSGDGGSGTTDRTVSGSGDGGSGTTDRTVSGSGDESMQGDQAQNNNETSDNGDAFPFSEDTDEEFLKKLWDFKRTLESPKEKFLLQVAIKKAITFLLKNDKMLNVYLDKDRPRVLNWANKVEMTSALLKKTRIDKEFLSTISTVDSVAEAQAILTKGMEDNGNKIEFIKSIPPALANSGGTLIKNMVTKENKEELIQLFPPKDKTETATRAEKKAVKKKKTLAQIGLLAEIMADKPDIPLLKLIARSSLVSSLSTTKFNELPNDLLCDKGIAINELTIDQAMTLIKKCFSMVKEVLKTEPDKLGILITKVTKDMLKELNADEVSEVVQKACKYERDLNIDVEKLLFSALKEKGVNIIKESDKASCTIKYAVKEIKDIDVKSELELVKSVCKNLGNSMNEKMSEESGKIFKDLCFKLLVDKTLTFNEFGNLVHFLDVSDLKELDNDQLLEGGQILSKIIRDKSVFEEISNRLKQISSLSNPAALTADDIIRASIFIGGWSDITKIPKESLVSAFLALAEAMKAQMMLKENCIAETSDKTACSQLDSYLKKVVQVLVAEETKRRRKRSTKACDCELPSQLGSAAEMISPESLKEMLCSDNFMTCMKKFGVVLSWNTSHQAIFAEKAKEIHGSPITSNWSESTLKFVIPAIPGLSVDEIASLDLNTLDLAFALGNLINWPSDKLKATFDVTYKKLLNSNNNHITSLELQTFRNLLCGMSNDIILSINAENYAIAARELGTIDCFTNDQHKLWVKKAKVVYQGVDKWSDSIIASMGAVIGGLSAEDLQKLTSVQIPAIIPDTIPMIAPDSLKNLHPNQFSYMTTSQIQKITQEQIKKLNSEQRDVITKKLKYINSFEEKNNSDGSHSNMKIPVIILSVLWCILY